MSSIDPKFKTLVSDVLDQFERNQNIDAEHSRLVYAILISEVFKRMISRFGFRTARIILRNLFSYMHRAEIADNAATQLQIKKPPST